MSIKATRGELKLLKASKALLSAQIEFTPKMILYKGNKNGFKGGGGGKSITTFHFCSHFSYNIN